MNIVLRILYSLMVYLATPLLLGYMAWRGMRNREYLKRWGERLGWLKIRPPAGGILVHAVSMGEVNGVTPLVRRLMQQWPERPIIFTCVTPTGSQRIQSAFGDKVFHTYLPIDLPGAISRLYRRLRPSLVVVMETEIWPNLFLSAASQGIPVVLVNARLSRRSASGYQRFLPQARVALRVVSAIAAQTQDDAQRFIEAGASTECVHVCGNLKGDVQLPLNITQRADALIAFWGNHRPVWLGASTHEGEEVHLLETHRALLKQHPDALLILVPRHPERFERVLALVRQEGFIAACHSQSHRICPQTQVVVVDAMGVLLEYAAAADLIFVGGSLVPIGGHNPLEPAALAKPMVIGPYHDNIKDLLHALHKGGGAEIAQNPAALQTLVLRLMSDPQRMRIMGANALAIVGAERGAVERTLQLIRVLIQ